MATPLGRWHVLLKILTTASARRFRLDDRPDENPIVKKTLQNDKESLVLGLRSVSFVNRLCWEPVRGFDEVRCQEAAMVQSERSELWPEERDRSKEAAVGDSADQEKDKTQKDRSAKISVEEHLAGLWNVLGLGD